MSVERQENWLGQQRVDVPHLRAVESSICGDFDLLAGTMIAGQAPLVINGFKLITAGITLASNLQLAVAGSTVIHYLASESGSIFGVAANRANETLNTTNPRVTGSFTPGQTNYIGLDFVRSADPTTVDLVEFINPNTEEETPVQTPLARTIDYRISISTLDFENSPSIAPIAIVSVDSTGTITSVQDARFIAFRLGTGGTAPNIKNSFSWPSGRAENLTGDVFSGGDKALSSFKEWMDAVMTRLWEVGGGEYWYSPTENTNEKLTRSGTPFSSNGEFMEWTGTNLHWKGLTWVFANSTAVFNDVNDQTSDHAGLTDLADGQCIYVDVDRTQNRTGGTALNAVKGTLALLGSPTVPGGRYVLAWRHGANIYTRDQSYFVGSSFKLATDTSSGTVKLSATVASLDNGSDPRVAAVDSAGTAIATAITRGGGGITNAVLFGSLGAGTLTVGGGVNDSAIVIQGNASAPCTVRANGALLELLGFNGDIDITAGGSGGGNLNIESLSGPITIKTDTLSPLTFDADLRVENTGYNPSTPLNISSGTLTLQKNWERVSVAGGTTIAFITVAPFQIGSKIYLRLDTGVIVTNNAGGPPAGTASILLSTTNPQRGPTTNNNSLLILYYDGTNWVEEGVF